MYIDIHIHASAWSDDTLTLDDVASWMKQHNIARGIVLQHEKTLPRSPAEQRRMVSNFASFRGYIDQYCNVPFDETTSTRALVRMLAAQKKDGAIGYGEHYFGNDYCNALPHMRLFEACAEFVC